MAQIHGARSGRSRCTSCWNLIEKDSLRIGCWNNSECYHAKCFTKKLQRRNFVKLTELRGYKSLSKKHRKKAHKLFDKYWKKWWKKHGRLNLPEPINELSYAMLQKELKKRHCKMNGKKSALQDRLRAFYETKHAKKYSTKHNDLLVTGYITIRTSSNTTFIPLLYKSDVLVHDLKQ
eukprot:600613_1